MQTLLDTDQDLDWLHRVHGIDTADAVCAILIGSEDAPDRVDVYAVNNVNARPIRSYVADARGTLVEQ